mmetsp:Transcript_63520/g.151809  ORF Transcript_63520/g.151809 Transcript_63520/m.151809 type:complete len:285 (-) Transcript_63520:6-860(-)
MAVGDGSVCEERCEDQVHLLLQVLIAHDVEEGLLLPSEGSVWQILGRRRRPHCERELLVAAGDAAPLFLQLRLKILLERGVHDLVTDCFAHLHQLVHICVDGIIRELIVNEVVDATFVQELLVGKRSGAEATWHRHTHVGELRDHLAQGGALAAHFVHIGVAEFLKRDAHARVFLAAAGKQRHPLGPGVGAAAGAGAAGAGAAGCGEAHGPGHCAARDARARAEGRGGRGGRRRGRRGPCRAGAGLWHHKAQTNRTGAQHSGTTANLRLNGHGSVSNPSCRRCQ